METTNERRKRRLQWLAGQHTLLAIAAKAAVSFQGLDQILKGTLLPPKADGTRSPRALGDKTAQAIEDAFTLGRGWFDLPGNSGMDEVEDPLQGVAHGLSYPGVTVPLRRPRVAWRDLVNENELPVVFELPMRDDGLRMIKRGQLVLISRSTKLVPTPDEPVLFVDKHGNHYIRNYEEVRTGHWRAVATMPGYAPMDSEADGLRVLGVWRGHRWDDDEEET